MSIGALLKIREYNLHTALLERNKPKMTNQLREFFSVDLWHAQKLCIALLEATQIQGEGFISCGKNIIFFGLGHAPRMVFTDTIMSPATSGRIKDIAGDIDIKALTCWTKEKIPLGRKLFVSKIILRLS